MIESLRRQRPDWNEVARGCQDGDRITIDFEGRIGGEAFEGGKSENLVIVLGAGRLLPEFEQGVRGAAAGEKREFDLRFPDDYQATAPGGKDRALPGDRPQGRGEPPAGSRTTPSARHSASARAASRRCAPKCARTWSASWPRRCRRGSRRRSWSSSWRRTRSRCRSALVEAEIRDMQIELLRRSGSRDPRQLPPRENLRAGRAPARRARAHPERGDPQGRASRRTPRRCRSASTSWSRPIRTRTRRAGSTCRTTRRRASCRCRCWKTRRLTGWSTRPRSRTSRAASRTS